MNIVKIHTNNFHFKIIEKKKIEKKLKNRTKKWRPAVMSQFLILKLTGRFCDGKTPRLILWRPKSVALKWPLQTREYDVILTRPHNCFQMFLFLWFFGKFTKSLDGPLWPHPRTAQEISILAMSAICDKNLKISADFEIAESDARSCSFSIDRFDAKMERLRELKIQFFRE